jgi:hypothetical protein
MRVSTTASSLAVRPLQCGNEWKNKVASNEMTVGEMRGVVYASAMMTLSRTGRDPSSKEM